MRSAIIDESLTAIRFNCFDPRCHQVFLQLSHNMSRWQQHAGERAWWLEQEKQCHTLFRQHGYDLQSGAWYCMIACQCHGWQGLTYALQLLVKGLVSQQNPCWPPLAAKDLRRNLLEWCCLHLLPVIYALPGEKRSAALRIQLLEVVDQLYHQAVAHQLVSAGEFKVLFRWLENAGSSEKVGQPRPPVEPVEPVVQPDHSAASKPLLTWRARCLWGTLGGLVAVIFTGGIWGLGHPRAAHYSHQLWPDNAWYMKWRTQAEKQVALYPANHAYERLNQQLIDLEQRLLDAEHKRTPYMTISALKTHVYQMRETLKMQDTLLENQLNQLQVQRDNQQPVSPAAIQALALQLEALQHRLLFLSQ